MHIGSRSSSAFCDFIYYNITQNVQKTQLLTTTLPLHTDTYLQKYPNFVSKSHLKPRTRQNHKKIVLKKRENKYSGQKSKLLVITGR